MKEDSEEGKKLRYDADHLLAQIAEGQEYAVRVTQAFYPAVGLEDRIRVTLRRNGHDLNCPCCNQTLDIPTPRQQKEMGTCLALCDYVSQGGSDYDVLLLQTVGDRLAEAASEYLSQKLNAENQWSGIRPAVGYPSLPDQKTIFLLARMIDYEAIGISLTENGAMYPQASVSGLYIPYPDAEYFSVK